VLLELRQRIRNVGPRQCDGQRRSRASQKRSASFGDGLNPLNIQGDFVMFILVAATLTLVGALGLVISSLAHTSAASEPIFNAAAVCLVAGPLVFFSYVVIGLYVEFMHFERESVRVAPISPSPLAIVGNEPFDKWIPEGLRRQPKGPLGRITGRATSFGP
jgi:hypothetical protein